MLEEYLFDLFDVIGCVAGKYLIEEIVDLFWWVAFAGF